LPELDVVAGVPVEPLELLTATWRHAFDAWPGLQRQGLPLQRQLTRHGDSARWVSCIAAMPALCAAHVELGPTITVGRGGDASPTQQQQLREQLLGLSPWRKGPFSLFGVDIDAEWRSDWKWQRVAAHLQPLQGRRVLDVGCGNGYYGWRMCDAGAALVVGVDPTVLYVCQYLALLRYLAPLQDDYMNVVLPAQLESLPGDGTFDTVFSMGVLYHRRDPGAHLRELHAQLRPGGELVLETLVLADDPCGELAPTGRYAGMRNVWYVPGLQLLAQRCAAAGFHAVRCVDVTPTTPDEQRATPWMLQRSLADVLDPTDRLHTIEGLPAPVRAIIIAER
jgi:tRNA (mo5U34)-methyltransferase